MAEVWWPMLDKNSLVEGRLLNDHHINYVQRLLHSQFPSIHGLDHILLQDRENSNKIEQGLRLFLIRAIIGSCRQILAVTLELLKLMTPC